MIAIRLYAATAVRLAITRDGASLAGGVENKDSKTFDEGTTKMAMQRTQSTTSWLWISVIALVVSLAGGWLRPQAVAAQSANPAPTRTITVVGEGKVRVQPDLARVTFGAEVLRPSVKEALAENKKAIEAILTALQVQKIAEKDIQTTGFSINAERYGPDGPLPDDQINYRVSNNVTVVIRDLENIGAVIDAAVEAGANNIYGIEFNVAQPSQFKSQVRQSAIADAKAKATELAQLTEVTIGKVVSVSEIVNNGGYFQANYSQLGLGGGAAPAPTSPISPGELEIAMQLQVTYEIAE